MERRSYGAWDLIDDIYSATKYVAKDIIVPAASNSDWHINNRNFSFIGYFSKMTILTGIAYRISVFNDKSKQNVKNNKGNQ